LNSSLESEGVEALVERLEDVLEGLRADLIDLIETLYSVLDDFGD